MKRPRKGYINTPPLERLQAARIVGFLRAAREQLARASAALMAAGVTRTAQEVDVMEAGIETIAERFEDAPPPARVVDP